MLKTIQFTAASLLFVPAMLLGYSSGPPAGVTGAPGDQTCVNCHSGAPLNGGGGRAALTSSAGSTYTPGQVQTLTLAITDLQAAVYGFEMSARLASNPSNGQAGGFTAGSGQIVICTNETPKGNGGCPANAALEFIEHTSPFQQSTITVTWTPPSSNVGPVTIYAAANAANGDFRPSGDHIYTAVLQLTPAVSIPKPTITDGGVVTATAFRPAGRPAPGAWIEIYGSDLATTTRSWQSSDFRGTSAPTSLDGVSVTIGGKSAYVAFISPGQVNAQVPDGIPSGSAVPLVLENAQGRSDPYILQTSETAPALLAPTSFRANGRQYVAAMFARQDSGELVYVGPSGAIRGVSTRPAAPGDVITFYGIGFGPVTPSLDAGIIPTEATALTNPVTILFSSTPGKILYAGLAPGLIGLYQFNVEVPAGTSGDCQITIQSAGRVFDGNQFLATVQ